MCNCIKEITEKTMVHLREPGKVISDGRIGNSGFAMSGLNIGAQQTYNPFEFTSSFTKKDGTFSKPKKDSVSLYHSFCPWCGIKYNG